jgi:hypothetical protein
MKRQLVFVLLCASVAIPMECQTTIGSPSSVGGVTDQASGSHFTRAQLIDRDVQKLKKYPPDVQQLLDPKVSATNIEAAYRDFRTTGQRSSPLDFLAAAKAIRQLSPDQIKDLSGKSSILALSLGSHGLLAPGEASKNVPLVKIESGTKSLEEQTKEAKRQLEAAIKSQ